MFTAAMGTLTFCAILGGGAISGGNVPAPDYILMTTTQQLTPALGRIILAQLETPKCESQLEIDGFQAWNAWDRQKITMFLDALAARGFVARETPPAGIRTPGAWKATEKGREAMTHGNFLVTDED